MSAKLPPLLLPDAGPLITLAYAGRLDLLLRPNWPLRMMEMVVHEETRNATPTRDAVMAFVADRPLRSSTTRNEWLRRQLTPACRPT